MFNTAMLVLSAIITSIVLMWSGICLTWAYYATDMVVHDMFSVIGPMFVIVGFASPFAIIEELR
tara:strand:- start:919 stop:1110 length:192 start_codon:yes stop_codon:yes gene_type:complete